MFRDANESDLAQICSLQLESWRTSYGGLVPEGYLGAQVELDLTENWRGLPPPPAFVIVYQDTSGEMQGFVTVKFPAPEPAYVDNLHVRPSAKGCGLGRRLMEQAALRLRGMGHSALWLTVLEGNDVARAFYRRLGGIEAPPFEDSMLGQPVRSCRVDWPDVSVLITSDR